jgi:hypothetical protein
VTGTRGVTGDAVRERPALRIDERAAPHIGTLREGALHADLRRWYTRPGDLHEQPLGGYVVDLVRGGLLVEFQTGAFSPLRRKLPALLATHAVRVVAPVPLVRHIVRVGDGGELLSSRRSPRRGRAADIFARLVALPDLLCHPRFDVDVLLTEEDEFRVHRPGRAWRRRGWVVHARALRTVHACVSLRAPADALALLPPALPAAFTTADVATAGGWPRRLAQQCVYCLAAMGVLVRDGRRGNAIVYRQAAQAARAGHRGATPQR